MSNWICISINRWKNAHPCSCKNLRKYWLDSIDGKIMQIQKIVRIPTKMAACTLSTQISFCSIKHWFFAHLSGFHSPPRASWRIFAGTIIAITIVAIVRFPAGLWGWQILGMTTAIVCRVWQRNIFQPKKVQGTLWYSPSFTGWAEHVLVILVSILCVLTWSQESK